MWSSFKVELDRPYPTCRHILGDAFALLCCGLTLGMELRSAWTSYRAESIVSVYIGR
jgi:hypothetical protein